MPGTVPEPQARAGRQHRLQDPQQKQAKCAPGAVQAVSSKTDLSFSPELDSLNETVVRKAGSNMLL